MSVDTLIYFALLALLAEILGTVGGFGSSVFFVPIAAYFLDFHTVLGVTAVFHVTSNLSKISLFKKGANKQLVLYLVVPAVVMVVLGAWWSQYLQTQWFEVLLAAFLVVMSSSLLIWKNFSIEPTRTNSVGGGVISGLLAGLLGTGGAIRGITMAAYNLSIDSFIATSALIDLGIDASRSVVYVWNGYVRWSDLTLILILAVVSFTGTYLGKMILKRFTQQQFRSIVLLLILATGIYTLVKFIFG
ncbi:MAG: sulfite exporter TauE/SafE family protein [Cytophagales bacterium]